MFPMMYGDHDLKKSSHVRWGRWSFNKVLKKEKEKEKKKRIWFKAKANVWWVAWFIITKIFNSSSQANVNIRN